MRLSGAKRPVTELRNETRKGSALIAAVVSASALFALSGTYLYLSHRSQEAGRQEATFLAARLASEEGLHRAMAELKTRVDTDGDGLGTVAYTRKDGRRIRIQATDLGGDLFRFHGDAGGQGAAFAGEMLVERVRDLLVTPAPPAVITTNGPLKVSGNSTIDGRDWDFTGSFLVGPGVKGISSVKNAFALGNATVGGVGQAPNRPAPPGTIEKAQKWEDKVDNDGDGLVDEEAFDGKDDDGDGLVDEDTAGFPAHGDAFLGFAPGTLKDAAIRQGTYFTSQKAVNDYLAKNGGNAPGGVILYVECDIWWPVDLGKDMNKRPSVIVLHNATGTAFMVNVTGAFKGLILADQIEHLTGDFQLLGALMAFADIGFDNFLGDIFSLGNADIRYSSQVLAFLPGLVGHDKVRVLAWHRASTQMQP